MFYNYSSILITILPGICNLMLVASFNVIIMLLRMRMFRSFLCLLIEIRAMIDCLPLL